MAHPAGKMQCRYEVQEYAKGTPTASGVVPRTWTTAFTVWGGRAMGNAGTEFRRGGAVIEDGNELVPLRYRAGIRADQRLLRRRDGTVTTGAVDADDTTLQLGVALQFDGGNYDYLKIGDEILRVTAGAGTTTLTVERGALETTAASHVLGAAAVRVEKLEIVAVERADEQADELLVRVMRNG